MDALQQESQLLGKQGKGFKQFLITLDGGRIGIAEIAVEVADEAIQIHGGYGYMKEYEVERYLRDAKLLEIREGTSEVQKLIITRHILHL